MGTRLRIPPIREIAFIRKRDPPLHRWKADNDGDIDDDEIETEAGICLPLPSSGLVSSEHVFDPIVFAPSSGNIVTVYFVLIASILVLLM